MNKYIIALIFGLFVLPLLIEYSNNKDPENRSLVQEKIDWLCVFDIVCYGE